MRQWRQGLMVVLSAALVAACGANPSAVKRAGVRANQVQPAGVAPVVSLIPGPNEAPQALPLQADGSEALPPGAAPDLPSVKVMPPSEEADQILVAMKPGTRVLLQEAGGFQTLKSMSLGQQLQLVKLPAGMSKEEAYARLRQQPGVAMVGPNRRYQVTAAPNDPQYDDQWALQSRWTKAPAAWAKGPAGEGITVAVLDTGVDYTHPELAGRVILGPNLADRTTDPMDTHGHGTHVAGIVAAAGNNAQGVAGVAWKAKILAIKVLGKAGAGNTDAVVEGIKYACDHGAKVINLSLGSPDASIDPVLHLALVYAKQKGVLVVAAAGNNGGAINSPANDPLALCVTSTSSFWLFEWASSFSCRGEAAEVAAPGGSILSTLPVRGSTMGQGYGRLSGTSMACPFVAGEAALIWSQHPTWNDEQVRNRIRKAVDDKGANGRDPRYGFGRVNLEKALD